MKNEKKLHGFSYYKNIANFEAFWRDKNFSKNLLFLGSELWLLKQHYLSKLLYRYLGSVRGVQFFQIYVSYLDYFSFHFICTKSIRWHFESTKSWIVYFSVILLAKNNEAKNVASLIIICLEFLHCVLLAYILFNKHFEM